MTHENHPQAPCPHIIPRDELEKLIRDSTQRGVADFFVRIGIDADAPLTMQADFKHLRHLRESSEKAADAVRKAAISVVVTAFLSGLYYFLTGKGPH